MELFGGVFATVHAFATAFDPSWQVFHAVPVGERVDLSEREGTVLRMAGSIDFGAVQDFREVRQVLGQDDDLVESKIRVRGRTVVNVMDISLEEKSRIGKGVVVGDDVIEVGV